MATTPAVHVARDRFHLAWDPGDPRHRDRGERFDGRVRPARRLRRPADRPTRPTSISADSTSTLSTRSTVRSQSRARRRATRSRSICSSSSRPTGAGPRTSPGSDCWRTSSPTRTCASPRCPRPGERAEFLPGVRVPIVPFCGEVGVAPIDRAAIDDPTRRPRREHGHAPPDGRRDAVPAGLP